MAYTYTAARTEAPDWTRIDRAELAHQKWLTPCGIAAWAQVCHDGERLFVRMEAKETDIRATLTGPLDQVCNDSCLEFFFAPLPGDARYFNFEWNRLGNVYVGFGAARKTRVRQIVKDVQALFAPRCEDIPGGWAVTFSIPKSFIRMYMPDFDLAGESACNFYKCGDMTKTPHYLAWSPLTSDTPDYHRRQDFGTLIFA